MLRLFIVTFAVIVVIGGVITFWLPIPIGLPLLMLGLPLIMKYSPTGRVIVLRQTKKFPVIYNKLKSVRRKKDLM